MRNITTLHCLKATYDARDAPPKCHEDWMDPWSVSRREAERIRKARTSGLRWLYIGLKRVT